MSESKTVIKQSVAREVAEKEINDWLDYKRISAAKKEANKDNIKDLISYVQFGTLEVNDDKSIKHNLEWPLGESSGDKVLNYKPRLNGKMLKPHMSGVKATDVDGRLTAYIAALTGKLSAEIDLMDTVDMEVARNIAVFFI